MSPGVGQEAGQTARGFIDALKGSPGILALSIINMMLLGVMFYALHDSAKHRQAIVEKVFENSAAIHVMLQQRSVACPDK
jgi:hypothetical protein